MTSKICAKCGASIPANAKFCLSCGTKLEDVCTSCGAKLFEGANFCGMCGHRLHDREEPAAVPVVSVSSVSEVSCHDPDEDDDTGSSSAGYGWKEIIEDCDNFDFKYGQEYWEKIFTNSNGDLNAADENGYSLIHAAARIGDADMIKTLIEAGVDVDLVSEDRGFTPLIYAAEEGRPDAIEALIEAGADVNKPDKFGNTAVSTAALNGENEAIEVLSKAGADINCPKGSYSPLMRAIDNERTYSLIALINAGVDPSPVGGWSYLLEFAKECDDPDEDLIALIESKIAES